jgi:hypothetical protein
MSESYNVLNDFSPEKFNLLIPVQSIQEVNPIYRIVINKVTISTNLADKEIYHEKNAKDESGNPTPEQMYAITHKGLMKLATAANAQVVESVRIRSKVCEKCIDIVKATQKAPACGTCPCSANVAYRVTMKFPELSGGWRIQQATREIDFGAMTSAKPGQIARMKEFAAEHAESKAMSRCIRKGLSVKNAYTLAELKKPFIVAYPVLDSRDADVKKALIAGSLAATNLLYGSGLNIPQLQAGKPEPEVDTETGEIIDADYEAEAADMQQDPQQNAPWMQQEKQEKYYCSNPDCGVEIAKNVAEQSTKNIGVPACLKCQQMAKKQGGK